MGQESTRCSCFKSKDDKDTAKFDNEPNNADQINNNRILSNLNHNPKEDPQQSNSDTNSFKDLKTYITFKNAIDNTYITGPSTSLEKKESHDDQLITNNKKHTNILIHQAQNKKEKVVTPSISSSNKNTAKSSNGSRSRMLGFHKSKSVNPFSGLKKDMLIMFQRCYQGYIYRKKYPSIKQEQLEYTYQLIKDLYNKYVTQSLKDMESSLGIKHNKNTWKNLITQASNGIGSALVTDFRLNTRLKIINGIDQGMYIGEVNIDNQMNGKGILIKSDGSKYEGSWEKDAFTGLGRVINPEGYLYEGFFTKGKLNGKGTKRTLSGIIYIGDFKNNLKQGKGKEETKDCTYDGNFQNDKRHGTGKLIDKLQKYTYEGDFVNNIASGYGAYSWSSNETYQGTIKNGKMDGKGIYKWPNGDVYEGDYINNIKEGQGSFKWHTGKIFIGEFKRGKPHGEGVFIINKKEYTGVCKDGKIVGLLKEIHKDEEEVEEEYNEEEEDLDQNKINSNHKGLHFSSNSISKSFKQSDKGNNKYNNDSLSHSQSNSIRLD